MLQTKTAKLALGLATLLLVAAWTGNVRAQTCVVTRDQVVADVEAGLTSDQIIAKYAGCTGEGTLPPAAPTTTTTTKAAPVPDAINPTTPASLVIKNTGNTFYEAIRACGYHPQREELTCTIEIRQRFGFGGQICLASGSHEWVLFCADLGAGLVPINVNGFHIHDERFGVPPNWYFAAVVQANPALLSQPNDGRTLAARAILSWNIVPPNNCNYVPIWGNQADFRIRLDP